MERLDYSRSNNCWGLLESSEHCFALLDCLSDQLSLREQEILQEILNQLEDGLIKALDTSTEEAVEYVKEMSKNIYKQIPETRMKTSFLKDQILLDLVSKAFKRTIKLIPLFKWDKEMIFNCQEEENEPIHILKGFIQEDRVIYLSIFPRATVLTE